MSSLKQRIDEYLRESSQCGVTDVVESDYTEYMRQREEIGRRGMQESLDKLKHDLSEHSVDLS